MQRRILPTVMQFKKQWTLSHFLRNFRIFVARPSSVVFHLYDSYKCQDGDILLSCSQDYGVVSVLLDVIRGALMHMCVSCLQ